MLAIALVILLGVWIGHSRQGIFDAGREVQLATEKATSALSALSPGFTGADLVNALNLEIINFAPGSAEIPAENYDFLNKAAVAIKAAPPGTVIAIAGYTDNTGDSGSNMQLSQQRALAVRNYLVMNGVDESTLTANGYGDQNPVASNDTEEGRFRNRRIQFTASNQTEFDTCCMPAASRPCHGSPLVTPIVRVREAPLLIFICESWRRCIQV